ncbi:MAG: iron chelate uptake ABC transporter family permease subunit [Nocardioides sp.]|uniref:FecCD family ABC transporter permease n=1 Tax=Nocardioides sp. TaxID=35761 RepID=UPI0039E44E19
MSTLVADQEAVSARTSRGRRLVGLIAALAALAVAVLLSLALGSRPLALPDVITGLFADNGEAHVIVVQQRIPRTVMGLMAGCALAVAGALMQGLTRNALAEPGLLGVSSGAAFAMVVAVLAVPGIGRTELVWTSFVGAVVATVVVYAIGSIGGSSMVTLVLAGVAVGAVLEGVLAVLRILNQAALQALRTYAAGTLEGITWETVRLVAPYELAALALAAYAARGLNAVALGDDLATALGIHQGRIRLAVVVAVTVLCGLCAAAVGLIVFVGMMVPHVARWITGPDQRWILAYSAVLGPSLLVYADVVGRVVAIPDEIPAGLVTAVIGAPALVWLVRRRRVSGL